MRSLRWCVAATCIAAGTALPGALHAQQAALQAKLEAPLDTRHATAGTRVIASALTPWHGPDCTLKIGASIQGHIAATQSLKLTGREATLALAFDTADCNGHHEVPLPLRLVALVRTELSEPEREATYSPGIFSPGGKGGAFVGTGILTEVHKSSPKGPKSIQSGDVVGLKKLTLDVGTGPGGASILHSSAHDFTLDTRVEFILHIPDSPAATDHAEETPAALPPTPPSPEPPDPTEICAASNCNLADSTVADPLTAGATEAIPLRAFGYLPRLQQRQAFDHDTTITYLSPQQVLVTFDSHRLRSRSSGTWPEVQRRPVRAILLNAQTGTVERVIDWIVEGSGQYLWPDGPGRVIVHTANSLQIFGPDLHRLALIPIDAPLQWVATSPSGTHIAVALLRERHTRETHAFIQDRTRAEPEEDLEIRLTDANGAVHLTHHATSRMQPPVLLDGDSELLVRHAHGHRWLICDEEAGAAPHTVATVASTCEPTVSALFPNAFFVVGCNDLDHWYRLIRSSGSTMLLGKSSPVQMETTAVAGNAGTYAVRVVRSRRALGGVAYTAADLAEERVAIYNTAANKQLLLARTASFPEATDNFALSPDGRQLALLTRSEVQFFAIANTPPTAQITASTPALPPTPHLTAHP